MACWLQKKYLGKMKGTLRRVIEARIRHPVCWKKHYNNVKEINNWFLLRKSRQVTRIEWIIIQGILSQNEKNTHTVISVQNLHTYIHTYILYYLSPWGLFEDNMVHYSTIKYWYIKINNITFWLDNHKFKNSTINLRFNAFLKVEIVLLSFKVRSNEFQMVVVL